MAAGGGTTRASARRSLAGIRAARRYPARRRHARRDRLCPWARTRSASPGSASGISARWARGRTPAPSRSSGADRRDDTEFAAIVRSIAAIDTLEAFLRDLRARYPATGAMPAGQQARHQRAASATGPTARTHRCRLDPDRASRWQFRKRLLDHADPVGLTGIERALRGEVAQKIARAQEARARLIAGVRELEQRERKLAPPPRIVRLSVGKPFDQFEPAAQRNDGFVDAAGGGENLAPPLQIESEYAPILDVGWCGAGELFVGRDRLAIGGKRVVDPASTRVRLCDTMVAGGDIGDVRACSGGTGSAWARWAARLCRNATIASSQRLSPFSRNPI